MKVINQDQFTIVHDLLERQDKALEQIDELNLQVEQAIKELSDMRAIELEQEEREVAEAVSVAVSVADATITNQEESEAEDSEPVTLPIDAGSSKAA